MKINNTNNELNEYNFDVWNLSKVFKDSKIILVYCCQVGY